MQSEIEPFPNNWAYLKTELSWLDRLLSLAIARHRQEHKAIAPLARSRVDRATSHWWKGLITLDGPISGETPASNAPQRLHSRQGYHHQLEAKILATYQRGIELGLPHLRDRLSLSQFEKNLVLLALAPEVSQRYGQIYRYLQTSEQHETGSLPTVDLALRLFCRNDEEWRQARQSLTQHAQLIQHQLLRLARSESDPLLNSPIQLADPLVDYLLADRPSAAMLEALLQSASAPNQSFPGLCLTCLPPAPLPVSWENLVLPEPLLASLKYLADRPRLIKQAQDRIAPETFLESTQGRLILLAGAPGTGKTLAVQTIAQAQQSPLTQLDLALLPANPPICQVLQQLVPSAPALLLLKRAEVWFGRSSTLSDPDRHRFLAHCRQHFPLTFLSVEHRQGLALPWRQQCQFLLEFPSPSRRDRQRLWQRAFPATVPLSETIDWPAIAEWPLTGGEIQTLALEALLLAAAAPALEQQHLLQAYRLLYPHRRC
jgi:hypothetical protein